MCSNSNVLHGLVCAFVHGVKANYNRQSTHTCNALQLSQKNLFFLVKVSVLLNFRRHAETDEFCSTSRERSMNGSSRLLTYHIYEHG